VLQNKGFTSTIVRVGYSKTVASIAKRYHRAHQIVENRGLA
jgi:hypothetical protein